MRPSRQRERAKKTRFFFSLGLLLFFSFLWFLFAFARLVESALPRVSRLLFRAFSEGLWVV